MTDPDLRSLEDLIEAYEQHQRRTRGLRDATLRAYFGDADQLFRVIAITRFG